MAEKFSYRNYFGFISKIMAMYGGILPDNTTARSQKIFKMVWILFIIVVVGPINVFLVSYTVVHIKSLTEVVDGFTVFACFFSTIKFYYAVRRRQEIEQLFTTIFTDESFQPKNEEEENIAVKSLLVYRILKNVFPISAQIAVVLSMFSTLEKTQYLPLMSWYPVDVSVSPFHEIAFIHQMVAIFFIGNSAVMMETAMTGFTSFLALQCDLICHRLENLESDDRRTLKEIIEVHKKVLSFVERLETTFGSAYFGQCLSTIACFAMILFLLGQETTVSVQFITWLFYVILIYGLVLIPCWFTSELTRRSEFISAAAFRSSWIESSTSFKKDLIYFMQMSQKPITISIFGFIPISLQTALKVIQTSFSYYTVLKTLKNK